MMMRWLVQLLARLKGGSGWSPQGGSGWYFPQAKTLTEHGELGKDADKGAKSVSSVRDGEQLHFALV